MGAGGGEQCPLIDAATIGFMGDKPAPFTATVAAVTPGSLTLTPDAGGPDLTFQWSGADLTQIFATGEAITYEGPEFDMEPLWYVFTGQTAFAAAIDHGSIGMFIPNKYDIPHGGPQITFGVECKYEYACQTKGTCYKANQTVLVGEGAAQVVVGSQQIAAAGDYQIFNNWSADYYTEPEATKSRSITVTGPVPPP